MNENHDPLHPVTTAVAQKPGIPSLAAAYVKASGELQNVLKDRTNPHFGSDYATLGALIDTVKPVFAKHDLALLQAPGEIEGEKINLHGLLMHGSGETVSFKMQIPLGQKVNPQTAGSAITYARRYQLAAVAGVTQVDDDGEQASAPPAKAATKTSARNTASEDVMALIKTLQATKTMDELTSYRSKVKEIGDVTLVNAYTKHGEGLRAAQGKAAA